MDTIVTIPRDVLNKMSVSEREETEATLTGLGQFDILKRQDRIDRGDEDGVGPVYETTDERMAKILIDIRDTGFAGISKNRTLINTLAAENGIM